MIDHEAEHVVLIQGKAFPDNNKGMNEPLVAPVEVPKYVIKLRFEFKFVYGLYL